MYDKPGYEIMKSDGYPFVLVKTFVVGCLLWWQLMIETVVLGLWWHLMVNSLCLTDSSGCDLQQCHMYYGEKDAMMRKFV